MGGPEFEFCVTGRAKLDEVFAAAVVDFKARDHLCVTAVEGLGKAEDGGQHAHDLPFLRSQRTEGTVHLFRRSFPVVARHERDELRFLRFEPAEIPVLDQVVRVLVMARIADVRAANSSHSRSRSVRPCTVRVWSNIDSARRDTWCACSGQ
jgi:hypothetical protein